VYTHAPQVVSTRAASKPWNARLARIIARLTLVAGLTATCAPAIGETPAGAGTADDFPGRVLLQLRPRYYYTDQSNKPLQAEAANVRSLLGYRYAPSGEFEFTGQIVNVSWLGPIRANIQPGRADFGPGSSPSPYPLVGDPDTTDLNLLYADYRGLADTRIRIGRQAIKLGNERFVGDADVRQMPQVFDAISVRNRSLPKTELFAAQAWHVRTYFGNRFQSRTTLLNARTQIAPGLNMGAYAYLQNQPQINVITLLGDNSNRIVGARLEGNLEAPAAVRWYYTAEAARQRPFANGDRLIRAEYYRLAAGPSWGIFSAQVDYERLGSNRGKYGFQMPLSYNTSQGWAYEFLNTPMQGLRDLNLSVAAALGRWKLWLKRHRFSAAYGGNSLGREWDFAVAYRFSAALSIRGVFGRFRSEGGFFRPHAQRYYVTMQYDY